MHKIKLLTAGLIFLLLGCNTQKEKSDILKISWEEIEAKAKGASLTMMMFQGDRKVNKYMNEYVVPTVKEKYSITLTIVPGQGKEIVSNIMSEKEAGKQKSEIDLCWINGETFFQLRQIDGLYGPYTNKLPNFKYVDIENPIIKYDFQQEVKGYETPWGQSFYYLIYDSSKVIVPPVTMAQFEKWWKANPGKFTFSNDFSGMTLLKSWLVELAGGMNTLDNAFDEKKYNLYAPKLWDWINANKKYFWKKGETFPSSISDVSKMYSNGELAFTMSFNDADIDNKVSEGVFAATSKAYILQSGSIQNTHYVGITANSGSKEAAMVVCNFLISPEAQIKKNDIRLWGSRTVLAVDKLEKQWQDQFVALPKRKYGLDPTYIKLNAIKELAPEYMIKVFEDFRKKVIEK
ncbi:MAG: ABC transporter substrate-binding protein [Sediminibacterium sp.]|nr:ABC transporter substrate-binding protein [Sediminibacterium sp.]MBX9779116.1 ABC transporter substrate-binding protein [Chitinophagaceae bacterium]